MKFIQERIHSLLSDRSFSEILTGSVWALLARVLATGLGLLCSVWIARIYGPEVVGTVAVINSMLTLATVFTVLGTGTSILRLIPEYLVKYSPTAAFRVYRKTHTMVIAASLFTGTALYFSSGVIADKVFSKPHLSFYLALAAMFVALRSIMLLNTQALRGLKLIRAFALIQVLPKGFDLILLVALGLLVSSSDVPVYALLGEYGLTGIVSWAMMERSFKKKMEPGDRLVSVSAKEILSISLPMLMTATMSFLLTETGVITLGMFRSEAEVGYYAIAVRLATLTTFILNAINSIAGPKFSELFHAGKMDELFHVARKSSRLIFWTTTPILGGLLFLGKPILSIIYGREFSVAYPALALLVMGQFVNSISGATGLFMNMTGNHKVMRNIMFVSALTNVGMNGLLVPRFGINGAAVVAMVCLMGWNICTLIYIRWKFGKTTGYFPLPAWV